MVMPLARESARSLHHGRSFYLEDNAFDVTEGMDGVFDLRKQANSAPAHDSIGIIGNKKSSLNVCCMAIEPSGNPSARQREGPCKQEAEEEGEEKAGCFPRLQRSLSTALKLEQEVAESLCSLSQGLQGLAQNEVGTRSWGVSAAFADAANRPMDAAVAGSASQQRGRGKASPCSLSRSHSTPPLLEQPVHMDTAISHGSHVATQVEAVTEQAEAVAAAAASSAATADCMHQSGSSVCTKQYVADQLHLHQRQEATRHASECRHALGGRHAWEEEGADACAGWFLATTAGSGHDMEWSTEAHPPAGSPAAPTSNERKRSCQEAASNGEEAARSAPSQRRQVARGSSSTAVKGPEEAAAAVMAAMAAAGTSEEEAPSQRRGRGAGLVAGQRLTGPKGHRICAHSGCSKYSQVSSTGMRRYCNSHMPMYGLTPKDRSIAAIANQAAAKAKAAAAALSRQQPSATSVGGDHMEAGRGRCMEAAGELLLQEPGSLCQADAAALAAALGPSVHQCSFLVAPMLDGSLAASNHHNHLLRGAQQQQLLSSSGIGVLQSSLPFARGTALGNCSLAASQQLHGGLGGSLVRVVLPNVPDGLAVQPLSRQQQQQVLYVDMGSSGGGSSSAGGSGVWLRQEQQQQQRQAAVAALQLEMEAEEASRQQQGMRYTYSSAVQLGLNGGSGIMEEPNSSRLWEQQQAQQQQVGARVVNVTAGGLAGVAGQQGSVLQTLGQYTHGNVLHDLARTADGTLVLIPQQQWQGQQQQQAAVLGLRPASRQQELLEQVQQQQQQQVRILGSDQGISRWQLQLLQGTLPEQQQQKVVGYAEEDDHTRQLLLQAALEQQQRRQLLLRAALGEQQQADRHVLLRAALEEQQQQQADRQMLLGSRGSDEQLSWQQQVAQLQLLQQRVKARGLGNAA